ncbi:glutamate--tRNA ligase MSE1 [Sporobolomyces koalae]|uniref:glutamate--tRNA ligase MSE1 n=1 Tax=Sporobolomyces koalae TaxID=500713 RepID=UPI0031742EA7
MLLPRWQRALVHKRTFSTRSPCQCPPAATTTRSLNSNQNPVKVRFAPSPTGFLHLGGLRTALYNHLLARQTGGEWVLRIEDTDQTRYVKGAVESLLRTLKWAQLEYDQGPGKGGPNEPYFQSQRADIYNRYLEPLIQQGKAYHCFCTPERLARVRKLAQKSKSATGAYDRKCLGLSPEEVEEKLKNGEHSISSSKGMKQSDLIYDSIDYDHLPIEDFVLRKSDGLPTYHFANVVDDYEMGITHVLRGEEWLPSTPKHLQLYEALGLPKPAFAHLPLLVNPDGSKLSKRTGDVKVEDYIDKGYEPSALLNFVALLGWSPQSSTTPIPSTRTTETAESSFPPPPEARSADSTATDVLSIAQLVSRFSLAGINKNRPTLQPSKLDWLNRNHVKMKLLDQSEPGHDDRRTDMAGRLSRVVERELGCSWKQEPRTGEREEYLLAVIDALKDRLHTINDIPNLGRYFFVEPDYSTSVSHKLYRAMDAHTYRATLQAAIPIVASLDESLFSLELSPDASHKIEQTILEALSSISIVTPAPTSELEGEPESKGISRKKANQVMSPLRHSLTGQKVGASVASTVRVLGRDRTRQRFERAIEWSLEQDSKTA